MGFLFTSESVSEGHPDKVSDQISDAILDEFLRRDANSKVACETLCTTGLVVVAGEVRSEAYVDVQGVARRVINRIGYTKSEYQFDCNSCGILSAIHEQSSDINQGVVREAEEEQGAGDQGIMFGYACNETREMMPATLILSHVILKELAVIRRERDGIALTRSDLRPRRAVMGRILRIGVPVALQDGLIQIAFLFITVIANRRGLTDAAAVGIVEKIISFLFLVPSSMLSTVSALGAQCIGAGKPRRALQTLWYAIAVAFGFGVLITIVIQFVAEPVAGLFTDSAAVAAAGGQYLRGYILDCCFAGLHFCFSGYFCAIGRSELSFLHNITAVVLVRVPGAYLMSKWFPTTLLPMGLATAAGSLLSVIICVIAFLVLRRRGRLVPEEA